MPETFGETVRRLRELKGLTQAHIAEACGVVPQAISNWERGTGRPSGEVCFVLARTLGMEPIELLRLADGERRRKQIPPSLMQSNLEVLPDRLNRVPVFNVGAHFDEDWTDGGFPVGHSDRYEWVLTEDQETFACILHGDSMEPGFHEGDLLIFEPSQTVEDGDFILLRTRDWATFKQIFIEDKRYRLTALNRRYPDVFLDRASDEILQLAKMTMHVRRY